MAHCERATAFAPASPQRAHLACLQFARKVNANSSKFRRRAVSRGRTLVLNSMLPTTVPPAQRAPPAAQARRDRAAMQRYAQTPQNAPNAPTPAPGWRVIVRSPEDGAQHSWRGVDAERSRAY